MPCTAVFRPVPDSLAGKRLCSTLHQIHELEMKVFVVEAVRSVEKE
jgi:hypothetical protein